jgi:hypothetical protein
MGIRFAAETQAWVSSQITITIVVTRHFDGAEAYPYPERRGPSGLS